MTMSEMTSYVRISPNTSGLRGVRPSKVTVHHMAGNLTIEQCGEVFAPVSRQASSNYGVGSDGRVGCYLPEEYHPWTSSNWANDEMAITIEVADYDTYAWSPTDAAYRATVELCADICNRYGIYPYYDGTPNGTFTEHMMFAATSCPGPWWHARMYQFVEDVREAMEDDYMTPQQMDEFIERVKHAVWEYQWSDGKNKDTILQDVTGTPDSEKVSNRYNVLNCAFKAAYEDKERLDAIEKKLDRLLEKLA